MNPYKIPLPNSWFRVGLLLMAVKTLSSVSVLVPYSDTADNILSLLAAGCFAVSLLQKSYCVKRLILFAALLVLALLSAWRSGLMTMVLAGLSCLAFYREDFDKSIRFLLFWELLYVLLHVFFAVLLSLLGEPAVTDVSGELRFHFGFSHPNVFSVLLINLLSMWVWLNYDRITAFHIGAVMGITALFCCFTGSRSALCAAVILAVLLILRRREGLLRFGAAFCVPVAALAEFGLWKLFDRGYGWIQSLDTLLSGRITLGAYALEHFGLSPLGQDLQNFTVTWDEFWQLGSFTFDDVYSYLAVNHGVVWLVLLSVLFFRAARKGPAKNCVTIILWALYGLTETHVINPFLFFPILTVSNVLQEENP